MFSSAHSLWNRLECCLWWWQPGGALPALGDAIETCDSWNFECGAESRQTWCVDDGEVGQTLSARLDVRPNACVCLVCERHWQP